MSAAAAAPAMSAALSQSSPFCRQTFFCNSNKKSKLGGEKEDLEIVAFLQTHHILCIQFKKRRSMCTLLYLEYNIIFFIFFCWISYCLRFGPRKGKG